jgi:hypothetical protein
MSSCTGPTTARILAVFTEEIAARRGEVTDTFDDGRRLFTRSILPHLKEVRPGDRLQGGVALKATGGEVWLHPYVFRQVCRNGAIMAQALQTHRLDDLHLRDAEAAEDAVREAVAACCADEVFTDAVGEMRTAAETAADLALNLLPMLSQLSASTNAGLFSEIMNRFFHEGDRSRFGLVNAVTSLARDTRDPEVRWNLEELGGGIAAEKIPNPRPDRGMSAAARRGREVSVG